MRRLLLVALLAAGAAVAAPPTVHDTIAQRAVACTTCHGKEGRATNQGYFPRIAGKPAIYLYNQLVNFREGRRHYAAMTYLVEHLSDAYLMEIAEYFAALDLPYPQSQALPVPPALLARGEALVRRGDAQRKLPACAACHGDALTGVQPALPGLLGLPRDYLIGQLGAWQTGVRGAHAPDCMRELALKLTPEEVGAVSAWLAAQPVPADAKPAEELPAPLPVPCGGVPR
jgi:cytochrome c553